MDPYLEDTGDDVPSVEEIRLVLTEAGASVEVEEQLLALTASRDGSILFGLLIGLGVPEFAKLMVDDSYANLKVVLRRYMSRGNTYRTIEVGGPGLSARIDPSLPAEAFLKLQGRLPDAPSGLIIWDERRIEWVDFQRYADSG